MSQFYAQPYDISANGFYFSDKETYLNKRKGLKNAYGYSVDEFELQFIDGETIDAQLFDALSVDQSNILNFLEKLEEWDQDEKIILIIAVGECGYSFDFDTQEPDDFEVEVYEVDSLKELAYQFVGDGLFGDIPEHLEHYLDYDAIAHDLGMDYSEITIDGKRLVYRCG